MDARVILATGLLAILGTNTQSVAGTPTATELVERWQAALGGKERIASIKSLHVKAKIFTAGLEGTLEEWTTSTGDVRQDFNLGGVYKTLQVFDGTQGWALDPNGKVSPLAGSELESQVTDAYFSSFSHMVSGRRKGDVQAEGMDDKGACYVVAFQPEGGKRVTVYLDKGSFLPVREDQPQDDRTQTTYLSDWREVDGYKMPFAVRASTGDTVYDVRVAVESVEINAAPPEHAFTEPQPGAKDYAFTAGEAALAIPFDLSSNHIYVQAKVNGSEPLWFIFDTGAETTVLDRHKAEVLGLPMQGQLEGRGAGENSVKVAIITDASFTLPGVELKGQTIAALPLDMVAPFEGRPVDGVLGYDLISRFVVKIDYAGHRLDLYEPAGFVYDGPGERIPLTLDGNDPIVEAELKVGEKTVKGRFLVDTGARTALSLSRPFCEDNGLVDAIPTISGGYAAGVGGETRQKIGRVASLKIGNVTFTDVVTGFSEDQKGAGASREKSGIIGGDVLRRFTVLFDYSHGMMVLESNNQLTQPFEYDMCGVFLRLAGKDNSQIVVHRVIPHSPAEEAGLKEGDLITSVDGKNPGDFTLEYVRRLFLEEGRKVKISYERAGKTTTTTITTRKLI